MVKAVCCFGGFAKIKQALAGGQSEYEEGLFYSGKHAMQSTKLLLAWLKEKGPGSV